MTNFCTTETPAGSTLYLWIIISLCFLLAFFETYEKLSGALWGWARTLPIIFWKMECRSHRDGEQRSYLSFGSERYPVQYRRDASSAFLLHQPAMTCLNKPSSSAAGSDWPRDNSDNDNCQRYVLVLATEKRLCLSRKRYILITEKKKIIFQSPRLEQKHS